LPDQPLFPDTDAKNKNMSVFYVFFSLTSGTLAVRYLAAKKYLYPYNLIEEDGNVAQSSDISSTEKLLKVIRDKKDSPAAPPAAPPPATPEPEAPKPSPVKPPLKFKGSGKKRSTTVGIDIGRDYLRLVKAAESGGKWRILARRRLPLPVKVSRDAPEFSSFLRTSLASFCGAPDQSNLWAVMSAANIELRHIRIPKVPKKQIPNAVFWTAKKEMPFNEKDAVFDFEVQGEVIEQGIPKLSVMVYTAPKGDVEQLRESFARIGWPLTGVSIVPFAAQNLFRSGWMPAFKGSIASLYIGNDFSRIDIFNGGNLVLTRGIKAGTTSMMEGLVERLEEIKADPKVPPLTMAQVRKVINSLSPDSPALDASDPGYGLAKEAIFEMIEPALERLVRQVGRTFEHYMTMGGSEGIGKIFVSGAMNIYQPMVTYAGEQLGIESAVLDPLSAQGAPVACPDIDDARNISERVAFIPALGLALSDNAITPNLIFTSRDKEKAAGVARINMGIFAVFAVLALICVVILAWQGIGISQKKDGVAKLEAELAALGPAIDREQVTKLSAQLSERRKLSKVYAERYLGMVIISELADLTPANIRLISLKTNLGAAKAPADPKAAPAKAAATPAAATEEVTLEGLVIGDRPILENALAGYVLTLEKSPVFRQITIQKNSVAPFMKGQALHFILNIKVEDQVRG
jgi:type IV pilus assembly protein PilM